MPSTFDAVAAFQAYLREVQLGRWQEAQSVAEGISAAVGSGHVMSLRAHGFLALKRNDLATARDHYVSLQQALPDDREAGLNLALIDWRVGDREAAAGRLARLVARYPDDAEVRALAASVGQP